MAGMLNKKWWLFLLPLPPLLLSFGGLLWYCEEQAVFTWPQVPGMIMSVKIDPPAGDDDNTYGIEWTYTYEVGGKRFTNDDFSASGEGTNFYMESDAKAQAQKYGEGTKVYVSYDPKNPSHSYIQLTEHSSGFDLMIVGIMFTILISIFSIIAGIKTIQNEKKNKI
jgi:hypothetical protein